MIKVERVQTEKSFQALADQLRMQILSGVLHAGEILNERALMEQAQISRGSVREALRVLETQGLLETRRGRNGGRMVIHTGVSQIADSLDIYIRNGNPSPRTIRETVELLEPGLAVLAARNRTQGDIIAMREAVCTLAKTEDRAEFVAHNADWHRELSKATGNPILSAIYAAVGPGILDPQLEGFVTPTVRAAVVHAAERILAAIIEGDEDLAHRRMTKHIEAYHRLLYP